MYTAKDSLWIVLGGLMTTTQIELNQELLSQAAAILGTKTKKATVNEALRRVVHEELRRRHVQRARQRCAP